MFVHLASPFSMIYVSHSQLWGDLRRQDSQSSQGSPSPQVLIIHQLFCNCIRNLHFLKLQHI